VPPPSADRGRPAVGAFALTVAGGVKDDPLALARALRRAVIARVQRTEPDAPVGGFFTGHDDRGSPARGPGSNHLAFQWDAAYRRLLVVAPHWLDHRPPTREERRELRALADALEGLVELRAGAAGRFAVNVAPIDTNDPLFASSRSWTSVTPYAVTRHKKRSTAEDAIVEDVAIECHRRSLPRPRTTVLEARGVAGRGLEGRVRLDFAVAVPGPLLLGRTRYLGGGLFQPVSARAGESDAPTTGA
jgi:CRISPR-associated protein Csb2